MSSKQSHDAHQDPKDQDKFQGLGAHALQGQQSAHQGPMDAQGNQPQIVYMSRPIEPHQQQISEETRQRHLDSVKKYPKLNLSEAEYVISAIARHPIGLLEIWGGTAIAVVLILVLLQMVVSTADSSGAISGMSFPVTYLAIPAMLIIFLVLAFGFIAATIYNANRFYLTNESVIQHIQTSLFNQKEQTISLQNIEDASYTQDGILPHMFNYGLLRLSTQGDETTYRFSFASNPKQQISLLNNAVEGFKNVRPIENL